ETDSRAQGLAAVAARLGRSDDDRVRRLRDEVDELCRVYVRDRLLKVYGMVAEASAAVDPDHAEEIADRVSAALDETSRADRADAARVFVSADRLDQGEWPPKLAEHWAYSAAGQLVGGLVQAGRFSDARAIAVWTGSIGISHWDLLPLEISHWRLPPSFVRPAAEVNPPDEAARTVGEIVGDGWSAETLTRMANATVTTDPAQATRLAE